MFMNLTFVELKEGGVVKLCNKNVKHKRALEFLTSLWLQ